MTRTAAAIAMAMSRTKLTARTDFPQICLEMDRLVSHYLTTTLNTRLTSAYANTKSPTQK
jgi:hypothetical protein